MRILVFSNWFPPIRSGSSFYASSLAQTLAGRGHEVVVVTLNWGKDYAPTAYLPFPLYKLPVLKLPKLGMFYNLELMGFAFTPGNYRQLKQLIAKHKIDIVHHVNHIFDSTFLTTAAAHASGIPVVGSITTPIQHEIPWRQKIMSLADRWTVGRFGVCRWDGIVSLDAMVHEYVGQLYGPAAQRRSVVIPFGGRMDSMKLYEQRAPARAERPTALFVGHIHPFRNPVNLLRAMPLVLQRVPNARLVLAGRTDLAGPLDVKRQLGLTDDQVQFLGETPHEKVVDLMKISQVFASWATGPFKGLGTAPMEAMLCETPVINDLPENLFGAGKLKDGENIVLVNSRDPHSIAAALVCLLTNEPLRQRIGAAGRRFVLEHLSWDTIAAQMEALYGQVLHEKGKLC